MAIKRIRKEMLELAESPDHSFCLTQVDDTDMFHWVATVMGPEGSPYDGGLFLLDIRFPTDYPFKPPKVQFTTPVFHPCVTTHGYVCLHDDILGSRWSPAHFLRRILFLVVDMLRCWDEADASFNHEACQMVVRKDLDAFQRKARQMTMEHAM